MQVQHRKLSRSYKAVRSKPPDTSGIPYFIRRASLSDQTVLPSQMEKSHESLRRDSQMWRSVALCLYQITALPAAKGSSQAISRKWWPMTTWVLLRNAKAAASYYPELLHFQRSLSWNVCPILPAPALPSGREKISNMYLHKGLTKSSTPKHSIAFILYSESIPLFLF